MNNHIHNRIIPALLFTVIASLLLNICNCLYIINAFAADAGTSGSGETNNNIAEIMISNTMLSKSNIDEFTFRVEPIEGWTQENVSSSSNGTSIPQNEVPMPEGTPQGQLFKDITISGFTGNGNLQISKSSGKITFNRPGWYLYKVKEVVPETIQQSVEYDKSEYFVVVYTEFSNEESDEIRVKNVTAWHNEQDSEEHMPDLEDISSITDNGGVPAVNNDKPKIYGKTGIGENSVVVKFWNSQHTGSLRVSKNVTGNLGDLTKRFSFTADISGLSPGIEYKVTNEGAEFLSGTEENGESFTADSDGNAHLVFTLSDDEEFYFDGLPVGASFTISEEKSDHFPSYEVKCDNTLIASDSKKSHSSISTGEVKVTEAKAYSVEFTNDRSKTPVTGVYTSGMKLLMICLAVVLLITARLMKSTMKR